MSDDWNFYFLRVDDDPASIFVDIGIAASLPLAGYPDMAYLRLKMLRPRDDGLSSQEEYDDLVAIEHCLEEAVTENSRTLYVGRNTSSGNRDFYFYSGDNKFESTVDAVMAKWPTYRYETGRREDREFSTYWRFLYPSPEDFQRMGNRDVIDQLVKHNDRIDQARQIDHFAIFSGPREPSCFVGFLAANNFIIARSSPAQNEEWEIEFNRVDRPDQIDETAIELFRAAKQSDGRYDGWGCSVVT